VEIEFIGFCAPGLHSVLSSCGCETGLGGYENITPGADWEVECGCVLAKGICVGTQFKSWTNHYVSCNVTVRVNIFWEFHEHWVEEWTSSINAS